MLQVLNLGRFSKKENKRERGIKRQEQGPRVSASDEGMKTEGILCVFRGFHAAQMEQKIRHPAADDWFIVAAHFRTGR